jgi:hypothetical protein
MCAPLVVAAVVASGVMKAGGSIAQGQAQSNMYKYQANVAEQQKALNTKFANVNIGLTQDAAAQEAKKTGRAYAGLEGTQKATMGAMGIGGVTAEDILSDTQRRQREDEISIRYGADLKSWQLKTEADYENWGLSNQQRQYKMAGANARKQGYLGAVTSLLDTATTFAVLKGIGGNSAKLKTKAETS